MKLKTVFVKVPGHVVASQIFAIGLSSFLKYCVLCILFFPYLISRNVNFKYRHILFLKLPYAFLFTSDFQYWQFHKFQPKNVFTQSVPW